MLLGSISESATTRCMDYTYTAQNMKFSTKDFFSKCD